MNLAWSRGALTAGISTVTLMTALSLADAAAAQSTGLGFQLLGRAQYDSNVARGSKAAAVATDVEPGDIRYTVSGSVDTSRRIGQQRAYVLGSVSYDFYDKNKSLERWRADITGGVGGRFGPCASGLNAAYVRTLSESSPISITDPRDSVETSLSYGISASCPLFGSIGSTTSVQQIRVRASGSRSQVGSDVTSVSTSVGYVSRTFGSFNLTGAYTTTDYLQAPRPVPFSASGLETYSVGLQYSRPIGNRLTGSANVSYFALERGGSPANELATGADTSGITWGVQLGYKASSRLGINLGYSDATSGTTRIGSAYQHSKRFNVGGSYQMSRRLSWSANASHVKRDFSGSQADLLGVASEESRTTYGVGLSYELGRNITLGADASRSEADTDRELLNYTSERVSVSIAAKF